MNFYQFPSASIAFVESLQDIPSSYQVYSSVPAENVNSKDVIGVVQGPRWTIDIPYFIDKEVSTFAVIPELMPSTSFRSCIISYEHKIIFLPNFKVMFSSFRDFMRNEFAEFKQRSKDPGSLNQWVDLEDDFF